jgi:hypothetical protein
LNDARTESVAETDFLTLLRGDDIKLELVLIEQGETAFKGDRIAFGSKP